MVNNIKIYAALALIGVLAGISVSWAYSAAHPTKATQSAAIETQQPLIQATPEELCANITNDAARAQCERGE